MKLRITGLTAIATLVVLGGCGGGSVTVTEFAPDTDVGGGAGEARAGLRPLGDADAFFTELRGALVAQRGGGDGDFVDEDLAVGAPGGVPPDPSSPAEPMAPVAEESAGDFDAGGGTSTADAADGGERLEVTETNVQESGVDEQDRVKVSADGRRLYVLQSGFGGGFPVEPFAVDDVESGETIEIEPGDVAIDPLPGGPIPAPTTTLRVLGLEAASAEATPLRDIELDLGGRNAEGMYLHESDAGSRVLLTSSGGGYWGYWDTSAAFGGLDSVVTRIDVDEPESAEITGSFRIDGQIVSSRRIGKYLFFASRFYPTLPGVQPFEVSAAEWEAAVAAADDATLLPGYVDESSGERTVLVDPGSCFVAAKPANALWYSPDIVTLAAIDLDTMELADSECYLGASETLYASPEAVYLATTRYDEGGVVIVDEPAPPPVDGGEDEEPVRIVEPGDAVDPIEPGFVPREPIVETDIHQFDIDGGELVYRGSGSVRGHLGFDSLRRPFRMSARDGFLRVATINDAFRFDGGEADVSPVRVSVLEPDGNGALRLVSELPNEANPGFIGKPGEQLYASRFIGDRVYLVTFRQTDPLYVVDLADPADPRVLGELEIEGYSDYLMPIGEDHLLGIGRDAVPAPDGFGDERGGFVLGIKLSLFDVSDPGDPREVDTLVVGQRGSSAEALFDHRGITVQHATDAHPTRVSFGIDVHGEAFPTERPDPNSGESLTFHGWSYTGLHGFDVRGGDGADIESRGAMVVERFGQDERLFGPGAFGDRAVMVNDAVFYVHGDRVYTATWDTLGSPSGPR